MRIALHKIFSGTEIDEEKNKSYLTKVFHKEGNYYHGFREARILNLKTQEPEKYHSCTVEFAESLKVYFKDLKLI
jgi:hypothetical protein